MMITGAISKERQDRVDPEEREIGLRCRLDDGGIRLSGRTKGAEKESACDNSQHDGSSKGSVFPGGVRHKGYAALPRRLVILALIGGFPYQASRHGPLIDAQAQHHPQMHADAHQQNARDDEDVQREEPGQRNSADDGPAKKNMHQKRPEEGHPAHDGGADSEAPIRVLIEAQHLAAKGHPKGEQ
jgi:hypothetical protein